MDEAHQWLMDHPWANPFAEGDNMAHHAYDVGYEDGLKAGRLAEREAIMQRLAAEVAVVSDAELEALDG